MDTVLAFITQPWVIALIAVVVFTVRVIYLARRLKSVARHPTLADMRALEEAKKSLDEHHRSLDSAKATLEGNLGGARDTLRGYKGSLNASVEGRRRGLESAMKDLGDYTTPIAKARAEAKSAAGRGLHEAKVLYKTAVPRKTHRAPKDI